MSDKTKYIYLAGIVDGEGCFSIGAGRRQKWGVINYNNALVIANTNLNLIKWLHENFGGHYFEGKKQRPNNKTHYVWRVLKRKDIELLTLAILPYLIVKREQAKVMLDFVRLDSKMNPDARKELFDQMRGLNRRGIDVSTNTQDDSGLAELKIESGLHGDMQSDPVVMPEPAIRA